MTDYPYDPELPFVLARIDQGDPKYPAGIIARFKEERHAQGMYEKFWPGRVKVIDTTPAPKIPADAEFIFYKIDEGDEEWTAFYARRFGNPLNKVWEKDSGTRVEESRLVEEIGAAEVVVLKRA